MFEKSVGFEQSVEIAAPPSLVFGLLQDVGGWRIWNRKIEFAALSADCQPDCTGMLYLRRLPLLRWHLRVFDVIENQRLWFKIHFFALHIDLCFELSSSDTGTQLRGSVQATDRYAAWLGRPYVQLWQSVLSAALLGVGDAANEVAANQAPE